MRRIFADTLYWVAITSPKDQWHLAARTVSQSLSGCELVTTEEVLTEFLTAFSAAGRFIRQQAVDVVRDLYSDASVMICPQTSQSFQAGLALYANRPDKQYSQTDCISMETMRREGIMEILTHDNHFTQDGFTKLL